MTNERLLELQEYLQKGLKAYTDALDSARTSAGYRAIVAPHDTEQLRIYQNQYNVSNEARFYITMLLKNFPELDQINKTK